MNEVWQTALAIIASVGAGGGVVVALSHWLGRLWANRLMASKLHEFNTELVKLKDELQRETESYKKRLRNSEFIFKMEYQAASALVELIATIEPSYTSPWMDGEELCEALEEELEPIEEKIGAFTGKHGAILPEAVRELIVKAQNYAGQGKFGDVASSEPPKKLAGKCYESLVKAEKLMIERVRDQSAVPPGEEDDTVS